MNSNSCATSKLLDIARAHPDWKGTILKAFKEVSDFLVDVWGRVITFFAFLIKKTGEFWNKVNSFFQELWNSIQAWQGSFG